MRGIFKLIENNNIKGGGDFMLLDASCRIAVKCSECGKYNIIDLNIFKMKIPTSHRCDCGHRMFKARVYKAKLSLEIDCIACEKQHSYRFKLKEVMELPINIISCPVTGIEIAFLGKGQYVNDVVKKYNEDMQEIFKSFGVIDNMLSGVVK
jgi:hypothetical protein